MNFSSNNFKDTILFNENKENVDFFLPFIFLYKCPSTTNVCETSSSNKA